MTRTRWTHTRQAQRLVLVSLVTLAAGLAILRAATPTPADAEMPTAMNEPEPLDGMMPRRFTAPDAARPTELRRDIFHWKHTRIVAPRVVAQDNTEAVQRHMQTTLRVSAIVMHGQPGAVVNGVVCRVGDTVAGCRVVRIGSRSVRFEREGVEVEIGL